MNLSLSVIFRAMPKWEKYTPFCKGGKLNKSPAKLQQLVPLNVLDWDGVRGAYPVFMERGEGAQ